MLRRHIQKTEGTFKSPDGRACEIGQRGVNMAVEQKEFGTCPGGEVITKYIIGNAAGMQAEVINYGAILTGLWVPDKKGEKADVVLGYDSLEGYFANPSFFGATVGPNANRTGKAAFEIDGVKYQLDINDGSNNLHSHKGLGFHKRLWEAQTGENSVTFTLKEKDGSLGFPGDRHFSVTYSLSEDNRLELRYHGTSDRKTVINMTNHTYFNLKGHDAGSIEDHILKLCASCYTPVAEGSIPTGEIAPVAGTPMDFTGPRSIGERIEEEFEQLKLTGGYDHNWVIDGWNGSLRLFAEVSAPGTDRVLRAYTDLPGVQFYAGNFIEPETGKGGAAYGKRGGFCLETQFYPDTVNKPDFPNAYFGPKREYDYRTVYEFVQSGTVKG